jgi:predicted  nucleic acid-binding Zn-ribbon protein
MRSGQPYSTLLHMRNWSSLFTQKDVPRESDKRSAARLDEQVQTAQARTRELESRLRPLMMEVKKLHIHAEKVKASLEDVLHSSEGSLDTNEAA